MISIAVVGAAGVVAWVATPIVAMARRGTIDQRTVAAMRAEPTRMVRPVSVPAPRVPAEERALVAS